MLTSLLIAMVCCPDGPPTSFDGSLQAYAAKISQTGATVYSVEATLQQEPVLIRSPDLALESPRIRELVAQAVQGEWVETRPGNFRLEIGRATADKLAERDSKQRTDSLAEWLKELKRTHRATAKEQLARLLEEVSSYDRRARAGEFDRAGVRSYDAPTPAHELLTALLLDLGPQVLARIPFGDSHTWSNVPVGEQERFPTASQSALTTFQSASERAASALSEEDLPKDSYPWEEFFHHLRRDRSSCKVLLTALPSYVHFYRLRVYDRSGELTDTAMLVHRRATPSVPTRVLKEWMPSERIPLSDTSAEFIRLTKEGDLYLTDISRHREPPRAELLARDTFEPLTVGFGELMTNMAEGSNKSIIAYLPDSVMPLAVSRIIESSVDGKGLWLSLLAEGSLEEVSEPDALVLRPENPLWARQERVRREGLHHYARSVLDRQGTTPRMDCKFYFEGGSGAVMSPVSSAFRHCLVPLVPLRSSYFSPWLGFLLGSFGDELWDALVAGRGVPVRALPQAQRVAFRKWLESGGPGRYGYEPSVASSNAIYDYQLFFDVIDDPLIVCTTAAKGTMGRIPAFPTRLSDLIQILAFNKLKRSDLKTAFDGQYDLIASTSTTAYARLGYVEWVRETLGDDASGKLATNAPFEEWPEALRVRLLRGLDGGR